MIKHSIKSFITLSVFIVALSSCNNEKKTIDVEEVEVIPDSIVELRDDQVKLSGIETGAIDMRSLSGTLKVSGLIAVAPQNLATVSSPLGGFVKSASLMPGSTVTKGQTLAILENQEFIDIQQNYLETKNKLEYAEAEYKRHTELYKDDVYSQKNLQQVTSEYKSFKTQLKALEQKLALIGINPSNLTDDNISRSIPVVSPISGYVKTVNVNIGKFVSPSDVLFEIVNSDNLFLELTLFEKDADKASTGQKIRFFINNESEQHDAVIYQTGKSISDDKTFKVYATVSGNCKNVMPGMYVNAEIEASLNQVTSVPNEAITSFDEKDYIFVFEKNKVEEGKPFTEYRMIQVQKGVSDKGFTEIVLPEGFDFKTAKVVVKGAYNLLSAKKNAGEMAC
ncbi:MAG: efflux RND transporter periplasmic adaptor subunit [Bacteroidales bacterium]|jgi:cobalt-zinc-cadmium efflux system membrane fusion protein|nr:efflux RND transporter periplasmic adaptor subunit [Bacteroidales bacterium]MBK9358837.1 efflux RND transporter periplasmic adaptor subunit [Bacteroidales bacterium]